MTEHCAGIVTFQPDFDRLKENLDSVTAQAAKVYIADNHSDHIKELKELLAGYENTELIENDQNYGIARALNQMCEKAQKDGYQWILTLDQDTVIPENLISKLGTYTDDDRNGIICPAVHYEGWDEVRAGDGETNYVYACMTSASLTRLSAWEKAGKFREEYFIDFVDNEFCMKLGLNGYKVLRVNSCMIHHRLGESGTKKTLGVQRRYVRHSPVRQYYMARNNAAFIREYKAHLPYMKEKIKLYYVLFHELINSRSKKETITCISRGLRDARRGKMGKYEK